MAANHLVVSMARLGTSCARSCRSRRTSRRGRARRPASASPWTVRRRSTSASPTTATPSSRRSRGASPTHGLADRDPALPDEEESTAYQGPPRGAKASDRRRSASSRRSAGRRSAGPHAAAVGRADADRADPVPPASPTAHGYALSGLAAPEALLSTPSSLQPLLEPSAPIDLAAVAAEDRRTSAPRTRCPWRPRWTSPGRPRRSRCRPSRTSIAWERSTCRPARLARGARRRSAASRS